MSYRRFHFSCNREIDWTGHVESFLDNLHDIMNSELKITILPNLGNLCCNKITKL